MFAGRATLTYQNPLIAATPDPLLRQVPPVPPVATPATTNPLWLLGIMAGLLSVVGIRKLRKA